MKTPPENETQNGLPLEHTCTDKIMMGETMIGYGCGACEEFYMTQKESSDTNIEHKLPTDEELKILSDQGMDDYYLSGAIWMRSIAEKLLAEKDAVIKDLEGQLSFNLDDIESFKKEAKEHCRTYDAMEEAVDLSLNKIVKLEKQLQIAVDSLKFYSGDDKYFKKKRITNLQETTAIFHVQDPSKLPTAWENYSLECTAKLKADQGRRGKEALKQIEELYK